MPVLDDKEITIPLGDASGTTALALVPFASVELAALAERTRATIEDATPENTRRAYEGDLRRFAAWCASNRLTPWPAAPEVIVLHMRELADQGYRYSTIERALAAICTSHSRSGHGSPWKHPLVKDMREGLKVGLGVRPVKKKAADDEVLRRLLAIVPPTGLLGLRDRALLTLGWAAALRRSELVALDVADVTRAPKGGVVLVRASKTDQQKRGEEVPIFFSNLAEHCPMRALDAWLDASGITEGAIFRQLGRHQRLGERLSPPAVRDRVRRYARLAELAFNDYGAHSLRSGFITTAARHGKDLDSIMRTTRHRSERIARGYIQRETLHERGAGEGLL
jgi:site-specific recombinase XerD